MRGVGVQLLPLHNGDGEGGGSELFLAMLKCVGGGDGQRHNKLLR